MISQRYRRDYIGEFVVSHTTFRDGVKVQDREWIPNAIENHHVSGRAAVIVGDTDRSRFDYARLQHHRGGLRGSKKLQTYGTDVTWQHLRLDFYVTTDSMTLAMIDNSDYGKDTVVYTDRQRVLEFPQKFFLTPYCPQMADTALALYLAAFDGHREIFVLGAVEHQDRNLDWQQHVHEVMRCYHTCQFYFVGAEAAMPMSWRSESNFDCMTVRRFVTHCDI